MSWRTVVISKQAKLSYKNGFMVIRGEDVTQIHLSEIHTVIVDSTAVSITTYLISEMMKNKIKLVFCDEKRSPQCEVIPYYGSHNTSKKIHLQFNWDREWLSMVWTKIIFRKIINQADHLKKRDLSGWDMIYDYLTKIQIGDPTNREGHAAKVYFNQLFGMSFSREQDNDINAALNYGYAILLSTFNKEIIANGYITQIGMKHRNVFNPFNLTSDIMEPFRVYVDEVVYENKDEGFDNAMKYKLIDILNKQVTINDKKYFLSNAIGIYVKSVFEAIEKHDDSLIKFADFI